MRLSIAALAAYAGAAHAFKDTSPFLLFSNSPLTKDLSGVSATQLQSSSAVLETTKSFVQDCPSELYYIISQPSLSSLDLSSPDSIPHLRRALTNPAVLSRYSVAEVVGLRGAIVQDLVTEIDVQCGGVLEFDEVDNSAWKEALREGKKVVITTTFEDLPSLENERMEVLADNDARLHQHLTELVKGYRYTVVYTSTPPFSPIQPSSKSAEVPLYESEFQNREHLDLKRDLRIREDNTSSNADTSPLFEKYQFLTPGLFMGLLVGLILISILSVGLTAIGSLQVSYGAFDKEMGPAAQKKQQ
ncbi:big1 [Hyphodiscus hymeniophilus]|uniref:Protein BIG1 n=1 Tax=Hyphodiscus hymeniophilus TaxID=353542 RepID=A0A9P6VDP1_9HELO|nr:big1 [Hyphodiscus hymeniophilus]